MTLLSNGAINFVTRISIIYMSAWANEAGTLQIEFLNNPGVLKQRNKENIAGITDYHSIKAGIEFVIHPDMVLVSESK